MRLAAFCLAFALACGPLQAQEIRPGVAAEKKVKKDSRRSDSQRQAPAPQKPAPVVQQRSTDTQPPRPGVAVEHQERKRREPHERQLRREQQERQERGVREKQKPAPVGLPIPGGGRPVAGVAPEPPRSQPSTPPPLQTTNRIVRCSASPSCASGENCRGVTQTFAGDNVLSTGRNDIARLCQQVNAASSCCAQQCAPSARCAAR